MSEFVSQVGAAIVAGLVLMFIAGTVAWFWGRHRPGVRRIAQQLMPPYRNPTRRPHTALFTDEGAALLASSFPDIPYFVFDAFGPVSEEHEEALNTAREMVYDRIRKVPEKYINSVLSDFTYYLTFPTKTQRNAVYFVITAGTYLPNGGDAYLNLLASTTNFMNSGDHPQEQRDQVLETYGLEPKWN